MSGVSDKRAAAIIGLVAGCFMIASGFTHGFGGWPTLKATLEVQQVETPFIESLYVGWWFGSFAMAALGSIIIAQSIGALRRGRVSRPTIAIVAVMYLACGVWAFVVRHMNPFFLLFIATGLLVACLLRLPDEGSPD